MGDGPPTIRHARADDAPELARVFLVARRTAMPYLPELHTDEETRGWMAEHVLGDHEVLVAELNGRATGFAALSGELLAHLYVDPLVQSQGLGTQLLAAAQRARPRGFRLWVFQRNEEARRFYERRGCRLVKTTDGSANEEREPDALYEWLPC